MNLLACKDNHKEEIVYEAADLMFHVLVALGAKNVNPDLHQTRVRATIWARWHRNA